MISEEFPGHYRGITEGSKACKRKDDSVLVRRSERVYDLIVTGASMGV